MTGSELTFVTKLSNSQLKKKSFCFGIEILSIKTLEDVKIDEDDGVEEDHVGDWLERHSETESSSLLLASKSIHTHNHVN